MAKKENEALTDDNCHYALKHIEEIEEDDNGSLIRKHYKLSLGVKTGGEIIEHTLYTFVDIKGTLPDPDGENYESEQRVYEALANPEEALDIAKLDMMEHLRHFLDKESHVYLKLD